MGHEAYCWLFGDQNMGSFLCGDVLVKAVYSRRYMECVRLTHSRDRWGIPRTLWWLRVLCLVLMSPLSFARCVCVFLRLCLPEPQSHFCKVCHLAELWLRNKSTLHMAGAIDTLAAVCGCTKSHCSFAQHLLSTSPESGALLVGECDSDKPC